MKIIAILVILNGFLPYVKASNFIYLLNKSFDYPYNIITILLLTTFIISIFIIFIICYFQCQRKKSIIYDHECTNELPLSKFNNDSPPIEQIYDDIAPIVEVVPLKTRHPPIPPPFPPTVLIPHIVQKEVQDVSRISLVTKDDSIDLPRNILSVKDRVQKFAVSKDPNFVQNSRKMESELPISPCVQPVVKVKYLFANQSPVKVEKVSSVTLKAESKPNSQVSEPVVSFIDHIFYDIMFD